MKLDPRLRPLLCTGLGRIMLARAAMPLSLDREMDVTCRPPGGTLLWLRRDLRLADHPGWELAIRKGEPVWPVFILDPVTEEAYGAAPRWRLGESLQSLASALTRRGSGLILRRGDARRVLQNLIAETGAQRVIWSDLYDERSAGRDETVHAALTADGIEVATVNASLIIEPWAVKNRQGGHYRVFTPYWKAVRQHRVPRPSGSPQDLRPPTHWPASEQLSEWKLEAAMGRGAVIVALHTQAGESAAYDRLGRFVESALENYQSERNFTGRDATSRLSGHLAFGEISPHRIWHACLNARDDNGQPREAAPFLRQLVWREFAYHLLYHSPQLESQNWRPEWVAFPWRGDNPDAETWRRGMTGIEMVDAAMREMYVTGTMHNRARMLVASFLTKHLLTHWRVGEAWFRECLTDWDIAANAMGWQWTAGSGPDAAPYFRIYNPDIQARKFDARRRYRDRFLAEGRLIPHSDALGYFDAVPRSWDLSPDQAYPSPVIDLKAGRERALQAYRKFRDR